MSYTDLHLTFDGVVLCHEIYTNSAVAEMLTTSHFHKKFSCVRELVTGRIEMTASLDFL